MAEMERFELSRRFTHPTPLAGEPLRPTWVHLRIKNIYFTAAASCLLRKKWRRRWDSNPRYLSVSLVFKTSSLNPSDTSPHRGKVYRPHQMQHFWQTPWGYDSISIQTEGLFPLFTLRQSEQCMLQWPLRHPKLCFGACREVIIAIFFSDVNAALCTFLHIVWLHCDKTSRFCPFLQKVIHILFPRKRYTRMIG